jgi:chromosomal replication initiator protein
MTLVEIGRRFGNRDHSTVLYACTRVGERVSADPGFASQVDRIRRELQSTGN